MEHRKEFDESDLLLTRDIHCFERASGVVGCWWGLSGSVLGGCFRCHEGEYCLGDVDGVCKTQLAGGVLRDLVKDLRAFLFNDSQLLVIKLGRQVIKCLDPSRILPKSIRLIKGPNHVS